MSTQQRRYRIGNQALVREMNLSLVMNRLRENAPISRSALAEVTGLNKTTVSSLVRELIEHQFVREVGLESTGTGRPAVLLELNPAAGCIISGEIGVNFISVICTNFATETVWQHKESIQPRTVQQAIIDRTLDLFQQAVEMGRESCGPVLGIAIGVPGLIDQANGTLLFAPNLGWQNVPLGRLIREAFGLPVLINNEANMAALGEHFFGAAQGCNEVLYVSAGVGLGGAIVRNGQLVRGIAGFAGEFGHMTMDPEGEPCNCGNRGCWETQVSRSALFHNVQHYLANNGHSSILPTMFKNDFEQLTVPMVVEAAQANDAVALDAFDKVGHYLGIGIASLVNALNPDLVVFGGILSLAGKYILPQVNNELRHRALLWNQQATRVVLAQHGFDACVMGGVAMVYQAILAQPNVAARQSIST